MDLAPEGNISNHHCYAHTGAVVEHPGLLTRLIPAGAPTLIFEVDAAGISQEAAPARRCDVRLIGSMRESQRGTRRASNGEVSAVLVLRALSPSRLLSCVRAVTHGGASMPPEVLCQLLPAQRNGDGGVTHQLTDRELNVLRLLADGDSTREIAERLSYSERTVKSIVHDVLAKLHCRTRAHAAALAARHGIV